MSEVIDFDRHRHHRREGYRVIIGRGLWRGFEVTVEPPTSTHPMNSFRTYSEAMAFAGEVQRTEGWPITAYCGDPDGGNAA